MEYQGQKIELNSIKEYTQIYKNKFKLVLDHPNQELEVLEWPYEIYYGFIEEVEIIDDRLSRFKVDIGQEKFIQVVSGILSIHNEKYKLEDLLHTRQMVLVNIRPVRLGGILSQGVFVFANEANRKPLLFEQIQLAYGDNTRVGLGPNTLYMTKQLRNDNKHIDRFYIGLDGYLCYENCALEINGHKFKVIQ
jgi:tRNA-binding EMAP/Myf-like protein